MTVNNILDRFDNFSYTPAANACSTCQQDYEGQVDRSTQFVREYFDGLCLDCMDKSKPKTKDEDTDFWAHNELTLGSWDRGCRIKHGEPTWYFSFMGRKERRELLLKKVKKSRTKSYVL